MKSAHSDMISQVRAFLSSWVNWEKVKLCSRGVMSVIDEKRGEKFNPSLYKGMVEADVIFPPSYFRSADIARTKGARGVS